MSIVVVTFLLNYSTLYLDTVNLHEVDRYDLVLTVFRDDLKIGSDLVGTIVFF